MSRARDAISPRLAISSLRMGVIAGFSLVTVPSLVTGPSHPEDAEAAAPGHRTGVHRGQRHAEHGTGVARVDDPVVVEPRADEERARLVLDLSLDLFAALLVGGHVEIPPGAGGGGPAGDR